VPIIRAHGASNLSFSFFHSGTELDHASENHGTNSRTPVVELVHSSHWASSVLVVGTTIRSKFQCVSRVVASHESLATPFLRCMTRFPKASISRWLAVKFSITPMEYNSLAWECRHTWRYGILCLARNVSLRRAQVFCQGDQLDTYPLSPGERG
jgi:hypothetical protein